MQPGAGMSDENHSRNARKGEAPDLERSPCPVVGIGASAGGLAALEKLFRAMPEDSGLAFVVVQHLHPERESHMTELIGRYTEMPVISVENGVHVQPDHVYVILPGQQLTIENGVLRLEDIGDARGPSRAIDGFLCSLAEDQEERAIGIILSGTGSNGTEGLKAIKAAGGVVLAQNPDTAEYPDMPRSAIGTGLVDVVSSPEQMPDVLVRYARHAYVRRSVQAEERAPGAAVPQLERVLALLGARGGHDFRMYKRTTLIRRIHRRMGLHSIERLADYHEFLGNHPDEVRALVKDLMISVTGFFRDPEAWELLGERVIAPLVAELDDGDPIRVWVSACATGEEAFSIALLIAEQAEALKKSLEVKIFATDTAEDNLSNARRGWFPASIEQHVSQARLQRFFEPTNDAYRIKSELRDWVIFAPHNLLQDPPFFRMDLVTCRNFMIYLDEEAQRRVIAMFHFALRENGHLFLGSAETVGRATDLFETVSKKWRTYRRTGATSRSERRAWSRGESRPCTRRSSNTRARGERTSPNAFSPNGSRRPRC
jgi:chemotaxis methyl-accepting protein methylase